MIRIKGLNQAYGGTQILWDLDLDIAPGSITCIMGRNGVGKTTLLKCLMGLLATRSGEIVINGIDYTHKTAESRARNGLGYVPQGRDIFPLLTVEENLRVALGSRRDRSRKIPERIFDLFPVLKEMLSRRGGDLSGGQQQQLAIGRALVLDPKVLILDEPNEGIQPNIVKQIGDVVLKLNADEGLTVVLVEQKLTFARRVGEAFRLMEKGRVVAAGAMSELSEDLIAQHLAV
ncbi:MAG: urea ABC transporter ATP-binding subunit UrtE [Gammaproteobacteria bacterium]|nr:urea ABC transporter ATP-binding subunit UrtE [Gammaproteobacteria bacterium]